MSTFVKTEVLSQLSDQGFRLTQTRKTLIDLILKKKGHWTVHDLTQEVENKIPGLGVATIYRTVALLHKLKYLSETRLGGASTRYEVASAEHHDHLTCKTCGEIFEFENDKIEELQNEIAEKLGFKLTDHRMELFGDCVRTQCKYKSKPLFSNSVHKK